ncbi:transmembrane protease serine 9-like [Anopheles bellator]|uniref:transmembrane protease serine 9-like n=1 Tax=Anopheles bellator TaxID=139047 RepID=UPI002647F54F|nr:transmembrane protease serine 9-like [Anopheles bellator]
MGSERSVVVRWWMFSVVLELITVALVSAEATSNCAGTYASDVHCGLPVLQAAGGLPRHPSEAIRGEFPWHVAIYQFDSAVPVYDCGGSLISDRFVLTAAHCAVNENNGFPLSGEKFQLMLGYHDLGERQDEGCSERVRVRKVHVHPEFRSGTYRHDIALLELDRPVRFTDRVLPVCLDTSAEDPAEFYRTIGKVPGWGYTEFDEVSSWLRMTEVPIVNYTRCLASNPAVFANTMHDGMFCGGYANGTNVCNGDSGGGFVAYRQGRWELQGIVSFTALRDEHTAICDTQQYSAYVKVRHYRAWIATVCNTSFEGPRRSEKLTVPPADEGRPACGQRKINKMPLIVNGVRSLAGEWPWHAAIFELSKRSREYVCGGTLISESHIVTAARCVKNWHPRKRPYVVQLGQHQLWESATTTREVRVISVETSDDSQMALLRLEADVQYDDYIQPICLPVENKTSDPEPVSRTGFIAGYGRTDPDRYDLSPVLQATTMPLVDGGLCVVYRIFDKRTADKMLCAGHGNGTNACLGDEGGGFYQATESGTWTIGGVISKINIYRNRCDTHGYVGVLDVAQYLAWILDRLQHTLTGLVDIATSGGAFPGQGKGQCKGCGWKQHRRHRPHHRRKGSDEDRSGEDSNESRERSIAESVKNVMHAKVDLVKDIHGVASSSIKKIFG